MLVVYSDPNLIDKFIIVGIVVVVIVLILVTPFIILSYIVGRRKAMEKKARKR